MFVTMTTLFCITFVTRSVICVRKIAFFLSFGLWWSVIRITKWMKYAHLNFYLYLYKWIKITILYFCHYKSSPEIISILVEINHPSININKYPNNTSNLKITKFRIIIFNVIVISPFSIVEFVSGCQINTPYVFLS